MVKDFPSDYARFVDTDRDAEIVVANEEAPTHLRAAGATLLELDGQRRFNNWPSRRWRGLLARALYRLADKVERSR